MNVSEKLFTSLSRRLIIGSQNSIPEDTKQKEKYAVET
jgi:hypothetical protein